MSKKKNESCDKTISSQLVKSQRVQIIYKNELRYIDYCTIDNGRNDPNYEDVILVTAFGAAWTLISPLGYELAKCGRRVTMVSLLGYGNSDDPPISLSKDFMEEATMLESFITEVFPGKKVHLVGHSFAAAVVVTTAYKNPAIVASLSLLNPAGLEKKNMLAIAARFSLNGFLHGIKYKKDATWIQLQNFLPKQKGSSPRRFILRLIDWYRLSKNKSLAYFDRLDPSIPYILVSGDKDFVYPYANSPIYKKIMRERKNAFRLLYGSYHNTTMLDSDRTAIVIDEHIRRSTQ